MVDPVKTLVLLVSLGCAACDDRRERCPLADWSGFDQYCSSAALLALRYAGTVALQQEDLDWYYDISAKAYLAEPLTRLARASAAGVGSGSVYEVAVYSDHEPVVQAWSDGIVVTGDPVVDEIFSMNGMFSVEVWREPPPRGTPSFNGLFSVPVSEDEIGRRMQSVPSTWLGSPPERPPNDISITVVNDQVILHMVAGWDDCASGCAYFHAWDVVVGQDGSTTVVDLGGDPIPAWMAEAARNSPDP